MVSFIVPPFSDPELREHGCTTHTKKIEARITMITICSLSAFSIYCLSNSSKKLRIKYEKILDASQISNNCLHILYNHYQ